MPVLDRLDVQNFLDSRPFGQFQWRILLICLTILILDGYDVVAMGFIAPALVADWGIARESLGVIMSAGLFGLALGALIGGPLADRFGRRKVIISAVLFFGIASLASAWAPDIAAMSVLRFLTGLGLGASQPNAATLASEYAPKKYKSLMVTVVYCGFTLGAAGGGFLATHLIADYGWASILVVGGVVPIGFAGLLLLILPESAKFLAARQKRHAELRNIINRMSAGTVGEQTLLLSSERHTNDCGAIRQILSKAHVRVTLLLWLGLFMNLLTVYFLSSWLPMIVKDDGYTLADAAMVGAAFQIGGTLGNIVIGWEMDRFDSHRVMMTTLLVAAGLTVAVGFGHFGFAGLIMLVAGLGFCVNATCTGWVAMSAGYYPTPMRATGTSWMTGIGRFGAISGAYLGAVLLGLGWDLSHLFLILTVPIGIAALAAFAKGHARYSGNNAAEPAAAVSRG